MLLIKTIRRAIRPAAKTLQAMARWKSLSFDNAPPIFGNAKPKSGSHLLLQVLNGFTKIMPYKYVEADPVRTIEKNGNRKTEQEVLHELEQIPEGVIGWGYVDATLENVAFYAPLIGSIISFTATRGTCWFRRSSLPLICMKSMACTTFTKPCRILGSG